MDKKEMDTMATGLSKLMPKGTLEGFTTEQLGIIAQTVLASHGVSASGRMVEHYGRHLYFDIHGEPEKKQIKNRLDNISKLGSNVESATKELQEIASLVKQDGKDIQLLYIRA